MPSTTTTTTTSVKQTIRSPWYKAPSIIRKAFPTRDVHPIYAAALRSTSWTTSDDPATPLSSPSRLFKYIGKTVQVLTKGFKAVLTLSGQSGSSTKKKLDGSLSAAPVEPTSTSLVHTPTIVFTTFEPASDNGTNCSTLTCGSTSSVNGIRYIKPVETSRKSSSTTALTIPLPPSPTVSVSSFFSPQSIFGPGTPNASPSVSETTAFDSPDSVKEAGFDFSDAKSMLDIIFLSSPALLATAPSPDDRPKQTSSVGGDIAYNKALLVPLPPSPTLTPSPSDPSAALQESIFDLGAFFAHTGPYGDSPEVEDDSGKDYAEYGDFSTSLTFPSSNFISCLLSDESFDSDVVSEWENVCGLEGDAFVDDRDSGIDGIMSPKGSQPPSPVATMSRPTSLFFPQQGISDAEESCASFTELSPDDAVDGEKLNSSSTSSLSYMDSEDTSVGPTVSSDPTVTPSYDSIIIDFKEGVTSNRSDCMTIHLPSSPASSLISVCSPDEIFDIGAFFGAPTQPKRLRKASGRAKLTSESGESIPRPTLPSAALTSNDSIRAIGTMGKLRAEKAVSWGMHKEKKGWLDDGEKDGAAGRSQKEFVSFFAAIFERL